ncbi:hypothetical protein HH1059_04030 [Halorhodospira halochloris]|uniref:Uncharacterized protein n=1 Tax=Halorhodospira halochloris TaxID=1052 RepID=A0A2Z6EZN7_HALHR|nr:hypothetical protein [Halorhodospira halochloris]MBK1652694.1 hypothetical protein [Halorhodospira halochloris]BBE10984.1 hypothetical protein HH1059_04030 [Halorhodospira halochloris]
MGHRKEDVLLDRIKEFYVIRGDGVARLRLQEAAKDPDFQEAIKKIAGIDLHRANDRHTKEKPAK